MNTFDLQQKRVKLWQALVDAANTVPFASDCFMTHLHQLYPIDRFWTYPGLGVLLRLSHYLNQKQYSRAMQLVNNCWQQLSSEAYRQQAFIPYKSNQERLDMPHLHDHSQLDAPQIAKKKPYFEVLIVHPCPDEYEMLYRQQLAAFKSPYDEFVYDIVFVECAEDALTAMLCNSDIQACVYLNHIVAATATSTPLFQKYTQPLLQNTPALLADSVEINLCRTISCIRPEVEHYLITEQDMSEVPTYLRQYFDRVLFHINPFQDLHAAILNGVRNRYSTPFFDALQAYSRQPKSVFHALPLSRGASVKHSPGYTICVTFMVTVFFWRKHPRLKVDWTRY